MQEKQVLKPQQALGAFKDKFEQRNFYNEYYSDIGVDPMSDRRSLKEIEADFEAYNARKNEKIRKRIERIPEGIKRSILFARYYSLYRDDYSLKASEEEVKKLPRALFNKIRSELALFLDDIDTFRETYDTQEGIEWWLDDNDISLNTRRFGHVLNFLIKKYPKRYERLHEFTNWRQDRKPVNWWFIRAISRDEFATRLLSMNDKDIRFLHRTVMHELRTGTLIPKYQGLNGLSEYLKESRFTGFTSEDIRAVLTLDVKGQLGWTSVRERSLLRRADRLKIQPDVEKMLEENLPGEEYSTLRRTLQAFFLKSDFSKEAIDSVLREALEKRDKFLIDLGLLGTTSTQQLTTTTTTIRSLGNLVYHLTASPTSC